VLSICVIDQIKSSRIRHFYHQENSDIYIFICIYIYVQFNITTKTDLLPITWPKLSRRLPVNLYTDEHVTGPFHISARDHKTCAAIHVFLLPPNPLKPISSAIAGSMPPTSVSSCFLFFSLRFSLRYAFCFSS